MQFVKVFIERTDEKINQTNDTQIVEDLVELNKIGRIIEKALFIEPQKTH